MPTKVKILQQVGQTGLRPVGAVLTVGKDIAKYWIDNGWAKKVVKPRAKKATKEE